MNKNKDIEFTINVKMSKRLAIALGVGGWIWAFLSTLYFSYVALSGENPIIDYTLGLPSMITYALGLLGIWGIIFSGIIGMIIMFIVGAVIIKYRR